MFVHVRDASCISVHLSICVCCLVCMSLRLSCSLYVCMYVKQTNNDLRVYICIYTSFVFVLFVCHASVYLSFCSLNGLYIFNITHTHTPQQQKQPQQVPASPCINTHRHDNNSETHTINYPQKKWIPSVILLYHSLVRLLFYALSFLEAEALRPENYIEWAAVE